LADAAHAIKGSVGNFSAPVALAAAQRLERLARSGDLHDADAASAALEAEIIRLRAALIALGDG
jgi:HPt (histidine-containing phosphotransfer) domain-containing protein